MSDQAGTKPNPFNHIRSWISDARHYERGCARLATGGLECPSTRVADQDAMKEALRKYWASGGRSLKGPSQ